MPPSRSRVIPWWCLLKRQVFCAQKAFSGPAEIARLMPTKTGVGTMKYSKSLMLAGAALIASSAMVLAAPTAKMKAAGADGGRPAPATARDENRKPADMLAFAGIGPGKVVVDMLPGGGYFTRIFAK